MFYFINSLKIFQVHGPSLNAVLRTKSSALMSDGISVLWMTVSPRVGLESKVICLQGTECCSKIKICKKNKSDHVSYDFRVALVQIYDTIRSHSKNCNMYGLINAIKGHYVQLYREYIMFHTKEACLWMFFNHHVKKDRF